jgi:hypothetical protein
MSVTALKLPPSEPIADKMRRLRDEAAAQARLHAQDFERAIADLQDLAADIADGGEAYPVGIREAARRLAPDLAGASMNITVLLGREN